MTQIIPLTNREREVVSLLLKGKSNKLIASALGISDRTVEFHLKNIYAKYQVSSRIELFLKLGQTTGQAETGKLGLSTVVGLQKSAENSGRPNLRMNWAASFRDAVSGFGEELEMKNLFSSKHVLTGVLTALFTGLLFAAVFGYFVHMASNDFMPWILPLIVIWALIGLSIGIIGKRSGSTLLKVCVSALFGTGLSPFAILPLMGFVVLPLGKLAESLGLINPSSMPSEVAKTLGLSVMLAIWFFVGTTAGSMLLFVAIRKPGQQVPQMPAAEQRL